MTSGPATSVVVVAASAGGVEALSGLVAALPGDLPAAVLVVLHVPSNAASVLPPILTRAGVLIAKHAEDGEELLNGAVYVAPPDRHLLISGGQARLSSGPRENGHRPAADPLFRSAALGYGSRATGIVVSGALDDGTAGLVSIVRQGGYAMVQDPGDAMHSGMPDSVLANLPDAFRGSLPELAAELVRHLALATGSGTPLRPPARSDRLESALWSALRSLEERVLLCRRLAPPAHERGARQGDIYDDAAEEAETAAAVIRELLLRPGGAAAVVPG